MKYYNYYRSQEPGNTDNEDTIREENIDQDNIQEEEYDREKSDNEDTDFYEGIEYMNRGDSSGSDYPDDSCGCEDESYNYMGMMVPPCCPYRQYMFTDPLSREQMQGPGGPPPPRPPQGPGFGPPPPRPPQGPEFGPPPPRPPQGPGFGPPPGRPPAVTPNKMHAHKKTAVGPMAVEPRTLRPCRFRFTFIWPERGRGFWAWITFVGRRSISGYRWNGYRWVYFGMDVRQIDSFICY